MPSAVCVVTFAASSGLLAVNQRHHRCQWTGDCYIDMPARTPPIAPLPSRQRPDRQARTITVSVIGSSLALTGPQTLVQPGTATYTVILNNASGNVGISGQAGRRFFGT